MNFEIKTIEKLKEEIHKGNKEIIPKEDFPEKIDFSFPKLYKEIVTKYDCENIPPYLCYFELYNSSRSVDVNNKFHNSEWFNNEYKDKIKEYWFIGEHSYYEYWIMDKNGKIYSWKDNINADKKILNNIIDLNINFEKWLQFAYLYNDSEKIIDDMYNNGMDGVYYKDDEKEIKEKYYKYLQELSKELYNFVLGKENE
jgi:hypothetical protein